MILVFHGPMSYAKGVEMCSVVCIYLYENCCILVQISVNAVRGFSQQYVSIDWGNGLAPNRRQAIIWTNDGLVLWRMCVTWPRWTNGQREGGKLCFHDSVCWWTGTVRCCRYNSKRVYEMRVRHLKGWLIQDVSQCRLTSLNIRFKTHEWCCGLFLIG